MRRRAERRHYQRYDTDMRIFYRVSYDIETKVKFSLMPAARAISVSHKYSGRTRNISIEGLCFASRKKLNKGDSILLEVYAPGVSEPVKMSGSVQWSKGVEGRKAVFHAGVKLESVNGKAVGVHFDETYKVFWSDVLESVFGSFKKMARNLRKRKTTRRPVSRPRR